MLGVDLYKEVLLNGKNYYKKEYKDKNDEIYHVGRIGLEDVYSIYRNRDNVSMLNSSKLEHGCKDIREFMMSELEELK